MIKDNATLNFFLKEKHPSINEFQYSNESTYIQAKQMANEYQSVKLKVKIYFLEIFSV